ncbi:MAG: hypothetical protein QMD00_02430 [Hadesarchaea archaeon]|nr:hypothetical protein [Hadesarchaea archaeon]
MQVQRVLALVMVVMVGVLLISTVTFLMPTFGSFPQRWVGENIENAVGQQILENAPKPQPIGTGATNVVTSVVWGYRGYDTLGEVTVLFTAVVGVVMVFRAFRRRE